MGLGRDLYVECVIACIHKEEGRCLEEKLSLMNEGAILEAKDSL